MKEESLDTLVLVTLCILSIVFVGFLIVFMLLFYNGFSQRFLQRIVLLSNSDASNCPESKLVEDSDGTSDDPEVDEVKLAPQLIKVLYDNHWVDDVSGLIPYSLGILKLCHKITERLSVPDVLSEKQKDLNEITQISRTISPRIDDVASAMYPPLEPRLLEARCTSLVFAFHLLVLKTQACSFIASKDKFLKEALNQMDTHLNNIRLEVSKGEKCKRIFKKEESQK